MEMFLYELKHGNAFIITNLVVYAFAWAAILERFVVIYARLKLWGEAKFIKDVEKQLIGGNMEKAMKLAQKHPKSPTARLVRAALANVRYGPAAVGAAIDEAMLEVFPLVRKRIEMLWSIANIATLIGLVGTIVGLIGAFKSLSAVDPEQKTAMLTAGISEAMINTAFGLTIAVTCIAAHMLLSGATKKIMEGAEHGALKIENTLERLRIQHQLREKQSSQQA